VGKHEGAYDKSVEIVELTGDQQWKTAQLALEKHRLANR